jgi:hypothetical protein
MRQAGYALLGTRDLVRGYWFGVFSVGAVSGA